MVDVHSRKQRSYNMSRIKSRDTGPEIKLRKLLFSEGLRGYRISAKLPGKPDIIFRKYKLAIFIDGCFWHKCPKCFIGPETHKKFWQDKIKNNVERDNKINRILKKDGWTVVRFWEHDIRKRPDKCVNKIIYTILKTKHAKKKEN